MIILFVALGMGGLVILLGALGLFLAVKRRAGATGVPSPTAASSSLPTAALPPVTRSVPHHPLSLLDGCSNADLTTLAAGIDGAISVGAPLYNSGNFAGCYHLYEGTAADIERKLSASCVGPESALESGRTRAASLAGPSAQAWAMRDAFDGILDVLERSSR